MMVMMMMMYKFTEYSHFAPVGDISSGNNFEHKRIYLLAHTQHAVYGEMEVVHLFV